MKKFNIILTENMNLFIRAGKCKLLKAWHQLDVRVARYHFESCDNAKFLGAMERYCHAVYLEVEHLWFLVLPYINFIRIQKI